jgi:cystathionine beta-lyase family protein involved in aluminum resistance
MEEVIGMRGTPGHGSLMEWGITYRWGLGVWFYSLF